MKKRIQLTFIVVFGLMAGPYIAWRSLEPVHRITSSSFSQIRSGMTQTEVEAIFGVPPGDYSDRSKHYLIWISPDLLPDGGRTEIWRAPNAVCHVYFDQEGKVLFYNAVEVRSTWFDQIKNWFGV
jgi:hypothetical protein